MAVRSEGVSGLAERLEACPVPLVWAAIWSAATLLVAVNAAWPDVGMGPLYIPLISAAGWRLGLRASCLVAFVAILLNIFPMHVPDAGLPPAVYAVRAVLRLFTYVFIVVVVQGFRRAYDRAQFMARHDAMTGALNKGAFERRIDALLVDAKRSSGAFLLATIDLDDFKAINDTFGHAAGDAAICAFAGAARGLLPGKDCLGRIGGDEFAFLMPVPSVEDGRSAAERFHARLAAGLRETRHAPSVSMGALIVAAGAGLSRLELMRKVDRALYEVKARGKGGVQIATYLAVARGAGDAASMAA